MTEKIIGITVGTPTSPSKIEEEIKPVKTVNGVEPDDNGNVVLSANIARTITLSADGWYNRGVDGIVYEVEFQEVTADTNKTHVICSVIPDKAMEDETNRCLVRLTTQKDGYLWFKALNGETPTIDITMNILAVGV